MSCHKGFYVLDNHLYINNRALCPWYKENISEIKKLLFLKKETLRLLMNKKISKIKKQGINYLKESPSNRMNFINTFNSFH